MSEVIGASRSHGEQVVPASVSVLTRFVDAGVLGPLEVHLAATFARLAARSDPAHPLDELVVLALAVAARAPRSGHVCVELDDVHRLVVDRHTEVEPAALAWPDPQLWAERLAASSFVASPSNAHEAPTRPLVWDGRRLYLQRLWHDEVRVAADLHARAANQLDALGRPDERAAALAAAFGTELGDDRQHQAAGRALEGGLTVIVGGPGTGKTRTVARLLAAASTLEAELQVALCAPTGKAAARMTDAVRRAVHELADQRRNASSPVGDEVLDVLGSLSATTVHRLLGRRRDGSVGHDARAPLPHDLVVVDETSMVDLPLMAQLLDAVRPDARIVLVGDPHQLASVEAGTVLADLVAPASEGRPAALAERVVELERVHRFGSGSGIAELARAVRAGRVEQVLDLLQSSRDDVVWVQPDDEQALAALRSEVVDVAVAATGAARDGDAAAALALHHRLKVLAATRTGPFGLHAWSDVIESGVRDRVRGLSARRWALGRPYMVTRNDPVARVANGDTGVVVELHDRRVLAIDTGSRSPMWVPVARLDRVEPWWAMTIHKSQGSEFDTVVVSLPEAGSPVLSRELLYTGLTRASSRVVLLASDEALRLALERPAIRASGLADRLVG